MLLLIVILTFGCLSLAVFSIYLVFARPASVVDARLEGMDSSLALLENNPMTTMAERVAEPLNRILPISAVDAMKLQKQLLQAGYRSPDVATTFRAIQILLVVALPTIVATVCFILDRPLNNFLVGGIVAAAIGFYLPRYVVRKKTVARQRRITWALADSMDLMVVAVEAGLALNAALNRVGEELRGLHPEMHEEISC